MARVPLIDSPCPIAGRPLPAGATDHCQICERTVHNLNRMSDVERRQFMSSCCGKVCVAYTVKIPVRRRGLAAATLAAAAVVALPAAAEGLEDLPHCDEIYDVLVTGGVTRGDQAEWVDDGKDAPPELPVIEDDGR
jgi:hypothetical protein